jgi:hypothetical protein
MPKNHSNPAATVHSIPHALLLSVARPLAASAILAGLLLACGCTTFNHEWVKAEAQPTPGTGVLGRWEGSWSSEVNGHNGNLRCVVTPKHDATSYRARFHAIYRKVIGFGYTVPLHVNETNGVFEFRGDANLGWWAGGVYHYEGRVQGNDFFCTYSCKYDHGTFQMKRLTLSHQAPEQSSAFGSNQP